MQRLIFGFVGGLATVVLSGALLWLLLPLIFSIFLNPGAWLSWFPFLVAFPAFLLGGFVAARLSQSYRLSLGFSVGIAASGALATVITGQLLVLLFGVFVSGLLGAAGARLSSGHRALP